MGVKKHKPTTPGRRKSSVDDFSSITKSTPEKRLTVAKKRSGGRNNQGKITVRHRGGGAKRRYRLIDFKRTDKLDVEATVKSIEYDPNRNARIALIKYTDGTKAYMIAPAKLKVDSKVICSHSKQEIQLGNRMPLQFIPAGIMVYNVELEPGKGGTVARSAGNGVIVQSMDGDFVQVKMPSGEIRIFDKNCLATVGQVSNTEFRGIRWGKAGRMRHRGIKPTVRGKAMNPVDHPHGGGEGSQNESLCRRNGLHGKMKIQRRKKRCLGLQLAMEKTIT